MGGSLGCSEETTNNECQELRGNIQQWTDGGFVGVSL